MNNKGFTLIELLAVIVILIGISLVAVTSISDSLERRDQKDNEEEKELIINAAKIYFSLNHSSCVRISTLCNNKYIDEDKIKSFDINEYVKIGSSEYSIVPSC